jgi:phage head maturation protease
MTEPLTLDAPMLGVEVRDIEKREVWGRIVPYGETIQVRGRPESFVPGALADVDITKVKLLDHHKQAIGKGLELEERADGAYALFRVSKTRAGNEALTLAADGVSDSFSPGFFPGAQSTQGAHTRVKSMPEVSLVTFPAYAGAKVLAIREKEAEMPDIETPESIPVDLTPLETRMDGFASQLDKLQTSIDAPRPKVIGGGPKPFDWFLGEVHANFRGSIERRQKLQADFAEFQTRTAGMVPETRELDDVVGEFPQATPSTDASGLVVQEYVASQLVNVLDRRRRLFSRLGAFPAPRSGYALVPVVTTHTEVGVRSGQKEAANSRPLVVNGVPFNAEWVDGAVDVAIELMRTAEPDALELVWNDLLGQYAKATEAQAVDLVEAGIDGADYSGTALDVSDYESFITDVATGAIDVEDGSDSPASLLGVTDAQWIAILAMVDADGRRILSTMGPSNADASAGLTSQSVMLPGGIEVFRVKDLTQAILTNRESFRAADYGPERVEAVNVELMGRDVGILGRTIIVPRIPAGIVVFGTDPGS